MGSKIHGDFVSSTNAAVVDRLSEAGAVFLGKLNMHEYALGGTTDNPLLRHLPQPLGPRQEPGWVERWVRRGPGERHGQRGTRVRHVRFDRIPAGFCGIVGLKPTYGRVSRFGCFPEAWTLDHVGPMTRSVQDAAIMLDAISGYDPRDPGQLNLPATTTATSLRTGCEGMTIGRRGDSTSAMSTTRSPDCVRAGIDALEERGAQVQDDPHPGAEDLSTR